MVSSDWLKAFKAPAVTDRLATRLDMMLSLYRNARMGMERRRSAPVGIAAAHSSQDAAPSEVIIGRQVQKSARTQYNGPQPVRFGGAVFAGLRHPSPARVELADHALHDGGAAVESGRAGRFEQRA